MLQIHGLVKSFGPTRVLNDVDLAVQRGQTVAIIGPSGSGKSTLLRCVASLEEYEDGRIELEDELIGYHDGQRRRRLGDSALARQRADMGMVFQSLNLFPHMTARANIMLGLTQVRKLPRQEAEAITADWLERVGLSHKAAAFPRELSGGQQQRVAIARAAAMQPKLLMLDEVTSALDPELVGEVLLVIKGLAERGMTMMIVTHEVAFARDVASEIYFMDEGQVVEHGPPLEMTVNPKTDRLRTFLERFTSA